ncbi:MAG: phospho-N-acetylmuramoyl-pentapeptide-transferase [Candidatus Omnitrophota bacterium]
MLYKFLYYLKDVFFGFNVFHYTTFRAVLAAISAFLFTVCLTPFFIRKLSQLRVYQYIRDKSVSEKLYSLHKNKEGTPTMGGIIILSAIIFSVLCWADMANKYIQLSLFCILWLGVVGFADDYLKLVRKRSNGLTVTMKLIGQVVLGLIIGILLYFDNSVSTRMDIPFLKNVVVNLGVFYVFFVMLVIIGSSNAVNITDGLDGLATGCTAIAALTYAVFSYITGHVIFSEYLHIIYVPQAGELSVLCAAIAGAGFGFLWFNCFPASIFMGDTGSLALGGVIGAVAVFIKKELLLVMVGGIFVVEALTVLLQITVYRFCGGKRLFLIAPLHHHFQVKGWAESKVTVRFWLIAILLAILSLSTLKLR